MAGTVVIAIGNEYRQDDGAAPAALRLLSEAGAAADRFEHTDGEATRLLALWQSRDLAVVIDAVHAHPGEPGRIHQLDLARTALARGGASTHGLGLGEAVELGLVLGLLPARLVVVGIEGKHFDWGEGLSPAVAAAVPKAAELVRELLAEAGAHARSAAAGSTQTGDPALRRPAGPASPLGPGPGLAADQAERSRPLDPAWASPRPGPSTGLASDHAERSPEPDPAWASPRPGPSTGRPGPTGRRP